MARNQEAFDTEARNKGNELNQAVAKAVPGYRGFVGRMNERLGYTSPEARAAIVAKADPTPEELGKLTPEEIQARTQAMQNTIDSVKQAREQADIDSLRQKLKAAGVTQ